MTSAAAKVSHEIPAPGALHSALAPQHKDINLLVGPEEATRLIKGWSTSPMETG